MASPIPKSIAAEILDALAPMLYADGSAPQNNALAIYVNALSEPTFQEVEDYASDDPTTGAIGYSAWVDIERCPDKALPWLAQFVGVKLAGGLTPSEQREQIEGLANLNRGTIEAMTAAVSPYLSVHNYLTNPEFETAISPWIPWTPAGGPHAGTPTSTLARSSAEAKNGTWSLLVTDIYGYQNWCQVPNFSVVPGETYTLTCWMKRGPQWQSVVILDLDWLNGSTFIDSSYVYDLELPAGVWKKFEITGTVPPGANLANIFIGSYSNSSTGLGDSFYVDSVELIKQPRIVPVILRERFGGAYKMSALTYKSQTPVEDWPATNYITNGNANTNTTGWLSSGTGVTIARSTAKSKYGTTSLLLHTNGGSNDAAEFNNLPGFATGDVVTLSAWVNPDVDMLMDLQINEYNSVPTFLRTSGGTPTNCPAGIWTRLTQTITLGASTTLLEAYVTTSGVQPVTNVYIGGVQLEKNPSATPYIDTDGTIASRSAGNGPVGNAIRSQKPAGIVLTYNVLTGQDYQLLKDNHATYALIYSAYLTYAGIIQDAPGV